MRLWILFLALAAPAKAWEFQPGLPCVLTHQTAEIELALTYDPTQPLYSITLTRPQPWPDSARFIMQFAGPQGRMIGTDRHVLSADRRSITVTDRGFGNVLDGLQYNSRAYAVAGDAVVGLGLENAAEPVAAFRACEPAIPTS